MNRSARGGPREKSWSVAIIDDNSVYFNAVGSVLATLGWPVTTLALALERTAPLIRKVRAHDPELIMIGAWQCSAAGLAVMRQLLAARLRSSLLVVHDGGHPCGGPSLAERIDRHEGLIACTATELDTFLCAELARHDMPAADAPPPRV